MLYLCQLLDLRVRTPLGEVFGRAHDFLIPSGSPYPVVEAFVLAGKGGASHRVPWEQVVSLDPRGLVVSGQVASFGPREASDTTVALREDLLDKQIVDTDGRRVVRVNDFQLVYNDNQLLVLGVDVSTRGLLRRLGCEELAERICEWAGFELSRSLIPWNLVEPLDERDLAQLRLTVSQRKLAELPPADLASILTDLHGRERNALFQSLNAETAAEALQELEEDVQVSIFNALSDEQAASVLEEMDPDEAADLMLEIPQERVDALLSRLNAEDAEDVKELLSYPPDSAGGIMTTEFLSISSALTSQQTIDYLREQKPDAEVIYYLYILDAHEHLMGVLALRDLVVAQPETPITEVMLPKVHKVLLSSTVEDVRDIMAKYDLMAIPVVDENNVMHGMVTIDDVMDRLVPATWKRRFPRFF